MVLCGEDCVPCCDFCIHAKHAEWNDDTGHHSGGPIACVLHNDEEHNETALFCGECDDFYCFCADKQMETQSYMTRWLSK